MPIIIYDSQDNDRDYRIDETAQRILVYLGFYGSSTASEIQGPAGAETEDEVVFRIEDYLGPKAAGLIETDESVRTLTGDKGPTMYHLTSVGEEFVYRHKAALSVPTEIEELAESVSGLRTEVPELRSRIEESIIDREELREKINDIEEQVDQRLEKIEDRLETLENEVSGEK